MKIELTEKQVWFILCAIELRNAVWAWITKTFKST